MKSKSQSTTDRPQKMGQQGAEKRPEAKEERINGAGGFSDRHGPAWTEQAQFDAVHPRNVHHKVTNVSASFTSQKLGMCRVDVAGQDRHITHSPTQRTDQRPLARAAWETSTLLQLAWRGGGHAAHVSRPSARTLVTAARLSQMSATYPPGWLWWVFVWAAASAAQNDRAAQRGRPSQSASASNVAGSSK